MLHGNTTHQDCETMVIRANRKHQIVLNMEVKRIEMEKKMRERYFCFEMSLMKARRLKILDRQMSLGIYRPHTMESGKGTRKARRTESVFFTQPVAMDSKVKLPLLSERRRTISGFPMTFANNDNSQRANKLSKNINRSNFLDKMRAKRLDPTRVNSDATEQERAFKDGNSHSKNYSKISSKESSKLDEVKAGTWVENRIAGNREIIRLGDALSKNLIIENHESESQSDSKNLGAENFEVKKERNVHVVNDSESYQEKQKENGNSNCNTPEQGSRAEPLTAHLLPKNVIQSEITCTQTQNISDLLSYHELQAWRKSWEPRILNSAKDFKVRSRLKSAMTTRYGKDIEIHEACAVKVRPQTALARLFKDQRKSS